MLPRFSLALSVLAIGCGLQQKPKGSDVSHTFGDTRMKNRPPLESCASLAAEANDPRLALATAYVRQVALALFRANPQTFAGVLAPERFCFSVVADSHANADADPRTGHVRVLSALLARVTNDAEFAGVLAHELAHVTLNHASIGHTYLKKGSEADRRAAFELDTRIQSLTERCRSLLARASVIVDLRERAATLRDNGMAGSEAVRRAADEAIAQGACGARCAEFQNAVATLVPLVTEMEVAESRLKEILSRNFTPEELANKAEQDADDVGLEFVMRADIAPEQYPRLFVAMDAGAACASGAAPARGTETHPQTCWRLANSTSEIELHAVDAARFLSQRRVDFISSPSLAEVQALIARVTSANASTTEVSEGSSSAPIVLPATRP